MNTKSIVTPLSQKLASSILAWSFKANQCAVPGPWDPQLKVLAMLACLTDTFFYFAKPDRFAMPLQTSPRSFPHNYALP